jgi:predicted RNA-binding Zn ribbon-like protein
MRHVFVSGNPALDLVGTFKWRRTPAPEELLRAPIDLQDWIEQSGLVDDGPAVTPDDLDRAVHLREAIYGLVTSRRTGTDPDAAHVAAVNAAAADPPVRPMLVSGRLRTSGNLDAILSTLAREALTAVSVHGDRLKECARTPCTRVFIDRSRGRRRTWCGMNECGAQVKVAAYRRRQRING